MNVSVRGAELHYSTRGEGPACLVLSAIGSRPYERMTLPVLSERLRLVFVELRSSGRSTGAPADLGFDVLAADLEAVRADLGVDRVAVLGHSILGMLAIEYGRRCPASVSHVIVAGTPPIGDMTRVSQAARAFFEQEASADRKRTLRDNLQRLPAGATPGQAMLAQSPMRFFDAGFDATPLFADADRRPGLLMHILGTLAPAWDVTIESRPLRVPLLIAHGRHDYTVPHTLWQGVVERLPGATFRLFERSGHQPFFEEPHVFATALAEWMTACGGTGCHARVFEP